jgi:hypothetical protein
MPGQGSFSTGIALAGTNDKLIIEVGKGDGYPSAKIS